MSQLITIKGKNKNNILNCIKEYLKTIFTNTTTIVIIDVNMENHSINIKFN